MRTVCLSVLFSLLIPASAHASLIISEYVEGSGSNKALEIYNTGAALDLGAAGYEIRIYFNGNTSAGRTIALSGVLGGGERLVLAHSGADAALLALADQTSGSLTFNGDDALVLALAGAIVDSFGQIGVDPGTAWGAGATRSADHTLRRMATVGAGDTDPFDDFDPAKQWLGLPLDTFAGLGAHTLAQPVPAPGTALLLGAGLIGLARRPATTCRDARAVG